MIQSAVRHRYLYVKNGDVVEQARRIEDAAGAPATSGPDAFLTDFVRSESVADVFLLSRFHTAGRYSSGKVRARVFADGKNRWMKLLSRPLGTLVLLVLALRYRPERILCGTAGSRFWICGIVSAVLRVPLVHSRHNRISTDSDLWFHRLSASIDAFVLRRCDGVACHGPYLVDEVAQAKVPADRIVEFDVDFDDFLDEMEAVGASALVSERKSAEAACQPDRRLLFVGRLERNKGVFDLLDALEPALKRDSGLKLVVAGHGSAQDAFEQQVRKAGLTEQVELLGVVDHREVVRHMLESYAVVTPTQPSFPEGRCMVVLESLVTGTPAVVPNFGPFPYAVADGVSGICFEAGSVVALREALERLLGDQQLYDRLRLGAEAESLRLRKPPAHFMQAIERAYRQGIPCSVTPEDRNDAP